MEQLLRQLLKAPSLVLAAAAATSALAALVLLRSSASVAPPAPLARASVDAPVDEATARAQVVLKVRRACSNSRAASRAAANPECFARSA